MSSFHHAGWWSTLTSDDPITLEPHSSLSFPPFCLHGQHFDPVALSAYIISRSKFENPLTRLPVTADECAKLDEHVAKHCRALKWDAGSSAASGPSRKVSVLEAFTLYSSVKKTSSSSSSSASSNSDEARRLDALRSAAAIVMQGLFSYDPWRPSAVSGDGTSYTVFDDGLVVAAASDAAAARGGGGGGGGGAAPPPRDGDFPDLLEEGAAKAAERKAADAVERLANLKLHVEDAAARRREEERGMAERAARNAERERVERMEREAERKAVKEHHELRIEGQRAREEKEREEREEARREIERWRADMFARSQRARDESIKRYGDEREAERAQKLQEERDRARLEKEEAAKKAEEAEEAKLEAERMKEEREKEKKLQKKQKEKERLKAKKEAERKLEEEQKAQQALKAKKDSAATKCAKCGGGIVNVKNAFDKFGLLYCSSACARDAAPAGFPKEL